MLRAVKSRRSEIEDSSTGAGVVGQQQVGGRPTACSVNALSVSAMAGAVVGHARRGQLGDLVEATGGGGEQVTPFSPSFRLMPASAFSIARFRG